MTQSRIEQFQAFLDKDPNNSFARYVIAQEQLKLGRFEEATETFAEVIRRDADYVAAYFHGGKALETVGRPEDARKVYMDGLAAADRTGNTHARGELQEALMALG
ncbi:MAG: tetratricopeptide repeat protein [Nitrospirota bacterium]|nr:tetratricopeptide repeat protein [Nitrospirota bacterium]